MQDSSNARNDTPSAIGVSNTNQTANAKELTGKQEAKRFTDFADALGLTLIKKDDPRLEKDNWFFRNIKSPNFFCVVAVAILWLIYHCVSDHNVIRKLENLEKTKNTITKNNY